MNGATISNCQFNEVWQVLTTYYLNHDKQQRLNCNCLLCFTPLTKMKAISYEDKTGSKSQLLQEVDITQVDNAIKKLHRKSCRPMRNYPVQKTGWYTYCLMASSQINIEDPTHPSNDEKPKIRPGDIVDAVVLFSRLLNKERRV